MLDDLELIAYETGNVAAMDIQPAPLARGWMDVTEDRFAYRCLPMVIANQLGWLIHNPTGFDVIWNGGTRKEDVSVVFSKTHDGRIVSHFGLGIVTFTIPYLFRTPPNVDIWVKGPSNYFKDGVHPLEGIVETDSSVATFTMNWKLTRSNHSVHFCRGEPIAMIVPIQRGFAESFNPLQRKLSSDTELEARYLAWRSSRTTFNQKLHQQDPEAVQEAWQRDYFLGRDTEGREFSQHRTRIQLRDFKRA